MAGRQHFPVPFGESFSLICVFRFIRSPMQTLWYDDFIVISCTPGHPYGKRMYIYFPKGSHCLLILCPIVQTWTTFVPEAVTSVVRNDSTLGLKCTVRRHFTHRKPKLCFLTFLQGNNRSQEDKTNSSPYDIYICCLQFFSILIGTSNR